MTIPGYLSNISRLYKNSHITEHSYRSDLQQLIETLAPGVAATNEPKRQTCGAPDYIFTKRDIPVGFIEVKDVGDKDLDGKKKSVAIRSNSTGIRLCLLTCCLLFTCTFTCTGMDCL